MLTKSGPLSKIIRVSIRALIKFAKLTGISHLLKSYFLPELIKEIGKIPSLNSINQLESTYSKLKTIASKGKGIIIGPWIAEVGFEVLYWIPFIRWFIEKYRVESDRIFVVSRGGAELWYSDITHNYCDVFDYFTPDEFKTQNINRIRQTGGQKHITLSDFDKKIIRNVSKSFGLTNFDVLHPSIMYNLFMFYWNERYKYPITHVGDHTIYKRFIQPGLSQNITGLPDEYIAVKFYFNESFPDTPYNRDFATKLTLRLSSSSNVVLLNTDLNIDDHTEFRGATSHRLIPIKDLVTPRNNLSVQTHIISRAKLFFGTYGGFSYIPPFYSVPSVSFYSNAERFLPVHLDVALRAVRVLKYGKFAKVERNEQAKLDDEALNSTADFIAIDCKTFDIVSDSLSSFISGYK